MAILSGGDFQLEVRTASGPDVWAVVGEMHTFNDDRRRAVSSFPVFNKSTPNRKIGQAEDTYSVEGYDDPADAGQAKLNTHADDGSLAHIRVTRDGTNGFVQDVYVTSKRYQASAEEESIQGRSYEFTGSGVRTATP